MKTPFFFFFFFFFLYQGWTQTKFSLTISGENSEFPACILEMNNRNYLLSYISKPTSQSDCFQNFKLLDSNGFVIKSLIFEDPFGSCLISNLHQVNDTLIIANGTYGYSNQNVEIWVLGLNPELEITWEKKYITNCSRSGFDRSIINSDGNIVIASTLYKQSGTNCLFMEISESGDLLYAKYLNQPVYNPIVYDILQYTDKEYILSAFGFHGITNTIGQILTIDSLFNVLQIDSIPAQVFNCSSFKKNTDSTFFLSGNTSGIVGNSERDIAIMCLDKNNDKLAMATSGKPGTIIDYGGYQRSMDYFTKSDIYVGGTSNQDVSPNNNYSTFKSWFMLSSYDSLLNLHWTKFYGGDAYYTLEGVHATFDNGCVMYGERYDYLTQNLEKDVLVIKVDQQGLYTGLDNPDAKAHDAIVYPNPGHDNLTIQSGPQINDAIFTLYDMQGRAVLNERITSTQLRLTTSGLAAGVYPWQIVYKNKVIESGKWVKE